MSFKVQERTFIIAESVFLGQLLVEIERLAKLVIQTDSKAKGFCMAMGTAFFNCEWVEIEDDEKWEMSENLDPEELADCNCYAADLAEIFDKWGDIFCLTGHPLRITMDPVTGELVAATDW